MRTLDLIAKAERGRLARRRRAADRQLRRAGLAAVVLALGALGLLIGTLVVMGLPGLTRTEIRVDFAIDADLVGAEDPGAGDFQGVTRRGMVALLPEPEDGWRDGALREIEGIVSDNTRFLLRDAVLADPGVIGGVVRLSAPLSDRYDQLAKGLGERATPEARRRLSDAEIARFDALAARGLVTRVVDWGFFTRGDSRFPETAGLAGALTGSFYVLVVCLVISFPVGLATAVWLEEFAPRGRIADLVEVNIANLAAVPSVVFGLLGLAVFIQALGLPRSAPVVGGMVLSLMVLPAIIIATRAALRAVPGSVREAAYGVGASRHQLVLHHVLPMAAPGIATGTLVGLARALGETAPLLLLGMNAFIADAPGGILDAATTVPTQVFAWAESAERGFVARAAAAILVLLVALLAMNTLAVLLRRRFGPAGSRV